jgi:hypothetical protein
MHQTTMFRLLYVILGVHTALGVAAPSPSLFDYETKQLTDNDLTQFSPEHRAYFGFDDSAINSSFTYKSGACKAQPTDAEFPQLQIWREFNSSNVVNGALIATQPLASSCYRNWGNYDESKCAAITANWSNPYLQ